MAGLSTFGSELPAGPTPPDLVLALLDEIGSPATVDVTHGRYFGFVVGGTDPAAGAATVLASAWDQNVGTPVMSPVGTHLDALAARWVCELLGLPAEATASFCAGATVANLTCVIAARDALLHRAGWDSRRQGLAQAPALRVVTGAEVHVSALKALHMAGIGTDAVTFVPTDEAGRLRADEFPEVDERTIVLLQAGNVNTGHSDPFSDLIPRARAAGAWVHVDGAFGLWAAASDRRRALVTGAEQADSWATDAHKWLNAPYDSGIAICAREEDLRRSFSSDAAYLLGDSGRVLMNLGVQMSQRARGVETWAIIASRGRSGIADIVDTCCDLAQEFAGHARSGRRPIAGAGRAQSGARALRRRRDHRRCHRRRATRRHLLGGRHHLAGPACHAAVRFGRRDDTGGHRRERACNPSLLERVRERPLITKQKVSVNVAADDPVIIEREGPLLILTLNRPKRMNAFTGSMLLLLTDAYAEADSNDEIRCIIITGAGGNFSSGADLRAMAGDPDDTGMPRRSPSVSRTIRSSRKRGS